jgi:hypothetical protein
MAFTPSYKTRNEQREQTLTLATMSFVAYFMGLGDDQATAESKVAQLSTEALKDGINASALPFMDAAAKTFLVDALTPTV